MTGIICLNKPKGITSFAAVAAVRRILGVKKVGHAGTLDPMATGVLPIFVGGSTRFIELLPDHSKGYTADVRLGVTTDTLDITGEVLSEKEVNITKEKLVNVLSGFRGNIMQTPPMYSAIQKDGVRLYELARKGVEIEREKRSVNISKLELLNFDGKTDFKIDVMCSKGTYIRSLADDIGKELGCGAVLTELCRTFAAGFSIENSVTLEELEEKKDTPPLIGVSEALKDYEKIFVTPKQAVRFSNGGGLELARLKNPCKSGFYRVFSGKKFLGVGEITDGGDSLAVKRVYVEV